MNVGISRRWYARPVFFVSDLENALRFYIDTFGFEKRCFWRPWITAGMGHARQGAV